MLLLCVELSFAQFGTITTPEEITVCPCESGTVQLTIANHEASIVDYIVDVGQHPWVDISQKTVTVQPGKVKQIKMTITPPCPQTYDKSVPGNYEIDIIVASSTGFTQTFTYAVTVDSCSAFSVTQPSELVMCSGGDETYDWVVINHGVYTDSYNVEILKPFEKEAVVNETVFLARAGKQTIIPIEIHTDKKPGNYPFNIEISSKDSPARSVVSTPMIIRDCSGFVAELEKHTMDVCVAQETMVQLNLENTGSVENNLSLRIEGLSFIVVDEQIVSLKPEEKKQVPLRMLVENEGVSEGEMLVESKNTLATIPLSIVGEKCQGVQVAVIEDIREICGSKQKNLHFIITNTGDETADLRLSLKNSQTWMKLEQPAMLLEPGEIFNSTIILRPEPGNITTRTYEFELQVIDRMTQNKVLLPISLKAYKENECPQEKSIRSESGQGILGRLLTRWEKPKQKIDEEPVLKDDGNEVGEEVVQNKPIESITNLFQSRWALVGGAGVALLILLFLQRDALAKIFEFFRSENVLEDKEFIEVDEEEIQSIDDTLGEPLDELEPSRIGKVILFVLVVGGAIVGLFTVGGVSTDRFLVALQLYQVYIGAGVGIGSVLLLLIRYRKSVVDYFEEEDRKQPEEREKTKQHKKNQKKEKK
ncbi:hypothetical protein CL622_08600 [archaeon]|nr:hypothetical protein [archaeon]